MSLVVRGSYGIDTELWYPQEGDYWLAPTNSGYRVGFDSLGLEVSGTLSHFAFVGVGTRVNQGDPMGTLEAEKFVGPISAPVSGVISALNDEALAQPSSLYRDPYRTWLVTIDEVPKDEVSALLTGDAAVNHFFERVEEYRRMGVLAQ